MGRGQVMKTARRLPKEEFWPGSGLKRRLIQKGHRADPILLSPHTYGHPQDILYAVPLNELPRDRSFVVSAVKPDFDDSDLWFRLAYAEGRILFVSDRHANLLRVQAFIGEHPDVSLVEAVRESLCTQPSV